MVKVSTRDSFIDKIKFMLDFEIFWVLSHLKSKKIRFSPCNQPFLKYPGGTAQASGGVAEPYLPPPPPLVTPLPDSREWQSNTNELDRTNLRFYMVDEHQVTLVCEYVEHLKRVFERFHSLEKDRRDSISDSSRHRSFGYSSSAMTTDVCLDRTAGFSLLLREMCLTHVSIPQLDDRNIQSTLGDILFNLHGHHLWTRMINQYDQSTTAPTHWYFSRASRISSSPRIWASSFSWVSSSTPWSDRCESGVWCSGKEKIDGLYWWVSSFKSASSDGGSSSEDSLT